MPCLPPPPPPLRPPTCSALPSSPVLGDLLATRLRVSSLASCRRSVPGPWTMARKSPPPPAAARDMGFAVRAVGTTVVSAVLFDPLKSPRRQDELTINKQKLPD